MKVREQLCFYNSELPLMACVYVCECMFVGAHTVRGSSLAPDSG